MDSEIGRADVRVILTTEADMETAQHLARELLERGVVACVTMTPVHSMYRWRGEIESSAEVQLVLKTTVQHLESARGAVLELHSYDLAEFLVLEADATADYGEWLARVVRGDPDGAP